MFVSSDHPPASLWHKVGQTSAAEVPIRPSPSAGWGLQWGFRLLTSWNEHLILLPPWYQPQMNLDNYVSHTEWMSKHLHMFEEKMLPNPLVNIFQIWCHRALWFHFCGFITLNATMTTTAEFCFSIAVSLLLVQPQQHEAELHLESGPQLSHSAQPRVSRLLFHSLSKFILFWLQVS